ncbi:hypothetical protein RIF29_26329 [Crotalaria pallida]|uniref:Helicase MAGATAMA 3 n=1 Tax=Crotalaria pallida TaxID=3830 RepID=A0AAN9EMK1_CROPI
MAVVDKERIQEESKNKETAPKLVEAKNKYKDVDDYISTYEPLIFEEAKSQILGRKNDDDDDEVTNWKFGVVENCSEGDGFHFIEFPCKINEAESISTNDLLLISKDKYVRGKRLPTVYAFSLVEHNRKLPDTALIRARLFLAGEFLRFNTDNVQPCPRLLNMRSHICKTGTERTLYFMKICSLSTIAREYLAIRTIGSLAYKDLILNAIGDNSGTEAEGWKIPKPLKEFVDSNFNQYQREAITAGLSSKAFVLIQGPPGTGKTQTILGILSTILHATPTRVHSKAIELKQGPQLPMEEKYKHWGLASPWMNSINPRDSLMPKDGDDGFFPTTGNELKPETVTSSRKYRVRVLVCAPSNSALDEIVLRVLNGGVHDENDRAYCPKIVRVGLKAHHSIKPVVLDELMKQKRDCANKSSTDKQSNDFSIRDAILEEATIVFSTLSFSGSNIFSKLSRRFDVVIIDEAAQAVEPATLVPLANQCKKVFLVGDPAQLPATVISDVAKNHGYSTSLFERLKLAGYPVIMLKTQYRMHPKFLKLDGLKIRSFPSKEFYEDSLEDGEDLESRTERAWHRYSCFGPFCFFDIHEGKETKPPGSNSWINVEEVDFVLFLYQKLVTLYPTLKSGNQVAIISPYKQQVKLLARRFEETFGVSPEKVVDICTVDGCQGREKDIAIFSCVRANDGEVNKGKGETKGKGIGFVDDKRRLNVGITRAKSAVLVVGSASTLKRSEQWVKLVESADKSHSLFKVSKPYSSFFSDESLKSMQDRKEELSQVTRPDGGGTDWTIENVAAPADDNDDGDVDMDNAGFDED